MITQLTFQFDLQPALTEATFCVGPSNEAAWKAINRWPEWPGHMHAIWGPKGSGKSHLAAIWADRANATFVDPEDVSLNSVAHLEKLPAIVFEEEQPSLFSPANPQREEALFHLFNFMSESGGSILFTSRQAPAEWPVALPDLLSRLQLVPSSELCPPDEETLQKVLQKLFGDCQLDVSEAVIDYIVLRLPRSFEAAQRVVARIDEVSLRDGLAVNKALAGNALRGLF